MEGEFCGRNSPSMYVTFRVAHPPGCAVVTSPKRASRAPTNVMEERSEPASSGKIVVEVMLLLSTVILSLTNSVLHPKLSSIKSVFLTSVKSGQLVSTVIPPLIMVAASIGRTEFLAPSILISPEIVCLPSIIYCDITRFLPWILCGIYIYIICKPVKV